MERQNLRRPGDFGRLAGKIIRLGAVPQADCWPGLEQALTWMLVCRNERSF